MTLAKAKNFIGFLFVTDTAHGATPVDQGKRRNIIRARSRPHRVQQWAAWASKI